MTPTNFLAILEGDPIKVHGGTGRVLQSTSED